MNELIFWWSIASTILNVGLLLISAWLISADKEREKRKNSQVKIWQQDANGLSQSLKRMVRDVHDGLYSSTQDMANSIWALEAVAFSLYQSLYEERCVTDEEYKDLQKEFAEIWKKSQNSQAESKTGTK